MTQTTHPSPTPPPPICLCAFVVHVHACAYDEGLPMSDSHTARVRVCPSCMCTRVYATTLRIMTSHTHLVAQLASQILLQRLCLHVDGRGWGLEVSRQALVRGELWLRREMLLLMLLRAVRLRRELPLRGEAVTATAPPSPCPCGTARCRGRACPRGGNVDPY